ncbi:MAG: hypothetical protein O2923_15000 [Verrucomicrobia bacterium]|nr:hypothetical protein [Verrucomicrobiota bacterium]MDA1088557.1 hypothetical protein [Verrucomicrobiota bacterium]
MKKLRMAVAQPYTRLGEVEGNLDQTVELSRTAAAAGCRLILFPETSLYGYSVPPEVLAKATTMVWTDVTPRTPQHLPPDALYPPPGAPVPA